MDGARLRPELHLPARIAYALQYRREDVRGYDTEADEWKLLADTPRFQTEPVTSLVAASDGTAP